MWRCSMSTGWAKCWLAVTHTNSLRCTSHQAHSSMKRNRLFHLFHCHCLTISSPRCFPSLIFYWWFCEGQASESPFFFASKAFSLHFPGGLLWNKQQISLLSPSASIRDKPSTQFCLVPFTITTIMRVTASKHWRRDRTKSCGFIKISGL